VDAGPAAGDPVVCFREVLGEYPADCLLYLWRDLVTECPLFGLVVEPTTPDEQPPVGKLPKIPRQTHQAKGVNDPGQGFGDEDLTAARLDQWAEERMHQRGVPVDRQDHLLTPHEVLASPDEQACAVSADVEHLVVVVEHCATRLG
jgi:hypothetical protein